MNALLLFLSVSLPPAAFPALEKLWDAVWPLLAGAGLVALGARLRRWFTVDMDRWLPTGDLGVVVERWLTRLGLRDMADAPAHDYGHAEEPVEPWWTLWLERVAALCARVEKALCNMSGAGPALLLILALLACLMKVR